MVGLYETGHVALAVLRECLTLWLFLNTFGGEIAWVVHGGIFPYGSFELVWLLQGALPILSLSNIWLWLVRD